MKVVAFNGSARKNGNTAQMVRWVFAELEKEAIGTELIQLAGSKLDGCIACYKCLEKKNQRCIVDKDALNDYIAKMHEAEGIILASPVYFSDVTSNMKSLIDRGGFVARANGGMYRRKVGAGVVAARRGGAIHTFDTLNHFFFISEMMVVGSSYWNMGFGLQKGEVEKDQEAKDTMTTLGQHMAWMLKKLHG